MQIVCYFMQVMRFEAGSSAPNLILGERFEPGSDSKHFCKPTDVAVFSTGEFFVSDGYVCRCFTLCCYIGCVQHHITLSCPLSRLQSHHTLPLMAAWHSG